MSSERLDPAAQPERTMLSWTRTALLLLVGGMLFFRAALRVEAFSAIASILVVAVASLVVAVAARRRGRSMWSRIRDGRSVVDRRLMAGTAALATGWSLACGALAVVWLLAGAD